MVDGDVTKVELTSVGLLSPEEDLLMEWAKGLASSSIPVSVDFHQTILGLTATFATLMAGTISFLVFGKSAADLCSMRWALMIPAGLMLSSSIAFCLGYYPRRMDLHIQDLGGLRSRHDHAVSARYFWAVIGCLLFICSILVFCLIPILRGQWTRNPSNPLIERPFLRSASFSAGVQEVCARTRLVVCPAEPK